jgi:NAD(P)H-dependent FMN reductase
MHVGIIIGTNRLGALSSKLGQELRSIYEKRANSVDLIDLAEMDGSFVDSSAYRHPSESVKKLVARFLACDAVVFIVPEYNGSYPGALKLYLDMFPFPQGFEKRPCGYVGLAAGQFQGLRAVEHLQQVAGYRNAHNFARRVFIGNSYGQFDESDALKDADLHARLCRQADEFLAFAASAAQDGGPAKGAK